MEKQRTALVAAICTLVLICVFAGTFIFSSMSYQTDRYKVTLPSEIENTEDIGGNVLENQQSDAVDLPELTPQNVQAVVQSLQRADQYVSTVTNTLCFENDETSVWRAISYFKNNTQKVEFYQAGETLADMYLFHGESVYAWEQGSTNYWSASKGDFTADMTAMIPSYRDVCELPVESIRETEMVYVDGVPCVRVICGEHNTEYTISVISGLLENVKYYENGELVREVSIVSSEEEIADSVFVLPGKNDPVFAS